MVYGFVTCEQDKPCREVEIGLHTCVSYQNRASASPWVGYEVATQNRQGVTSRGFLDIVAPVS